jgi:hypothetical protein
MATTRGRGNTDGWQHKRITLPDGSTLGWTVDPGDDHRGPSIVAFFRRDTSEGLRLLREAGHGDADLPA